MARVTPKRVERTIRTARELFGLTLPSAHAHAIIRWDDENMFVRELADDGHLDTAPRDYFRMAVIEVLLPGPPSVQDHMFLEPQDRWHWPAYGSSPEYSRAFLAAWRRAVRSLARRTSGTSRPKARTSTSRRSS